MIIKKKVEPNMYSFHCLCLLQLL